MDQADAQAKLSKRFSSLEVHLFPKAKKVEDVPREIWARATFLCTLFLIPPAELVPRLKFVQLYTAGINQITDSDIFKTRRDVIWSSASGVHGPVIAE